MKMTIQFVTAAFFFLLIFSSCEKKSIDPTTPNPLAIKILGEWEYIEIYLNDQPTDEYISEIFSQGDILNFEKDHSLLHSQNYSSWDKLGEWYFSGNDLIIESDVGVKTHVAMELEEDVLKLGMFNENGGDEFRNVFMRYRESEIVLQSAWHHFENEDYTLALSEFKLLINRNVYKAEAYMGCGWSLLRTPGASLIESLGYFIKSTESSGGTSFQDEILAGSSIISLSIEYYDDAIKLAERVNSSWTFEHDATLNYKDIVLVRAIAWYALGSFAKSLEAVKQLDAGFSADVNTIAGRTALAEKIEALKDF